MNKFKKAIEDYVRGRQEKKEKAMDKTKAARIPDEKADFVDLSNDNTQVRDWISSASKRASQISLATHIIKYTHSDAKGSSIYFIPETKGEQRFYVSADCLQKKHEDFVGNAAAMDVPGFLHIEVDGITLLEMIFRNDSTPFACFAENEEQLVVWMKGFQSIVSDQLSSHQLAKQVYFPVGKDKYHLLSPLYASTLSHELYERLETRFSEEVKTARERKKNGEYSDVVIVDYPDLVRQIFGGTKPQNISLLNTFRRGKSYLLRSAPPIWKSLKNPPFKRHAFWKRYGAQVEGLIRDFKSYLYAVRNLASNWELRDRRQNYVEQFLDVFVAMAAEIQTMKSGWSANSEISIEEQLWLDPMRDEFVTRRADECWQEAIATRFATWIVRKIEGKDFKLSDGEHAYFRNACLNALKEVER